MAKSSSVTGTFSAAAGPHWFRTIAVIGSAAYTVATGIEGVIAARGWEAFLPTVPKVVFTIVALSVLMTYWFFTYAHRLRLQSLPKLKLVKIVEGPHQDSVYATNTEIALRIKNTGTTALSGCRIKVDHLSGNEQIGGHYPPKPLGKWSQRDQRRLGKFDFAGLEEQEIPLCYYRRAPRDTHTRLYLSYEDEDGVFFDPDDRSVMAVGFYSDGAPTQVSLKFERDSDGRVNVTEVKE